MKPTKAQVHAAARRQVQKAFANYEEAESALKAAKKALDQAHKLHWQVTGYSYGEKEFMTAFKRRVGPLEVKRLAHLRQCHDLANKMFRDEPQLGLRECQTRAWKQLGWNADCSARLKRT